MDCRLDCESSTELQVLAIPKSATLHSQRRMILSGGQGTARVADKCSETERMPATELLETEFYTGAASSNAASGHNPVKAFVIMSFRWPLTSGGNIAGWKHRQPGMPLTVSLLKS